MSNKVYIVDNGDLCIFGIFTSKDKAQYICDQLNNDYPEDSNNTCYVEERELDVVKSWIIIKKLDELGIKIIPDDSY